MSAILSPSGFGMEICVSWVTYSNNLSISNFIPVAEHCNFENLSSVFIGRALYNSEWCPGFFKLNILNPTDAPGLNLVHVDHCDTVTHFEVLCDTSIKLFNGESTAWKVWQAVDEVPRNSVVVGSHKGTPVYIARTNISPENVICGAFIPSVHKAVFNLDNKLVLRTKDFEVLVTCNRDVHPDNVVQDDFASPY